MTIFEYYSNPLQYQLYLDNQKLMNTTDQKVLEKTSWESGRYFRYISTGKYYITSNTVNLERLFFTQFAEEASGKGRNEIIDLIRTGKFVLADDGITAEVMRIKNIQVFRLLNEEYP